MEAVRERTLVGLFVLAAGALLLGTIAAISVSGPASRLTGDQLETTTAACLNVARTLSTTLAGAN